MTNETHRSLGLSNDKQLEFKTHMEEFRLAIEEFVHHRAAVLASRGAIGVGVEQYLDPQQSSHRHLTSLPESNSWTAKMKEYSLELIDSELEWIETYRIPLSVGGLVNLTTVAAGIVLENFDGEDVVNYGGIKERMSSQCIQFRSEILDLYDNINFFVLDNLERMNDISEKLLKLIDSLSDLEKDLKNTQKVDSVMSKVVPLLGKIPYAGPLVKIFYTLFHSSISQTEPVTKGLTKINKKIEDLRIKKRLELVINVTTEIGQKINQARGILTTTGHGLIVADAVCSNSVTQDLCADVGGYLSPVNNELNELREDVVTFVTDLKGGLYEIAKTAESAISSDVYKGSMAVMSSAAGMFNILEEALNEVIGGCVTIPVCGFRKERFCKTIRVTYFVVKRCKRWGRRYPCGLSRKTKVIRQCFTVSLPYSCPLCARFTIGQLVNGVVSVFSLLTKVLDDAMDSFIKSLGIKFDLFQLPAMPSVNALDSITVSVAEMFDSLPFDPNMPALNDLKELLRAIQDKLPVVPTCK
jgi:hypothetical protein